MYSSTNNSFVHFKIQQQYIMIWSLNKNRHKKFKLLVMLSFGVWNDTASSTSRRQLDFVDSRLLFVAATVVFV